MDLEKLFEAGIVLGIDALALAAFYKLYKEKSQCLKTLKSAEQLDLNNELKQVVQNNGGSVSYAAITGKVIPLAKSLKSEHNSMKGVIKERIVTEYKIRWIPSLHIWSSVDNNVNRRVTNVPFALCARTGLFQKKIAVEIADPLSAQELILAEVFNDYTKHDETLSEAIIGFICKEHTLGVRKVENMLLEDASMTAVGKIVIENDKLKMIAPDNGSPYYLTPLSFDALCKKISNLASFYKGLTIAMCCISSVLLAYYFRKAFIELKRQYKHRQDMKRCKDAIKLKKSGGGESNRDDQVPKCVICLDNCVEVIILECGHACLCFSCSENIRLQCPVCRSNVNRIVPVFMP